MSAHHVDEVMCGLGRTGSWFAVDQWKVVLADLRRWLGPVQTTFTGGEALLKPFAVDLVAHGTSLGLFVEILTHGYWPDQSKIEELALARPWRITISLDGLGLLGFESVLNRDYPVVFATLYIFSLIGGVVNLISDLTYTWIDPRIDFETREV